MHSIIKGLPLVLFFSFSGCQEQQRKSSIIDNSSSIDTNFHDINSFGQVKFGDTSRFYELKCGLYINSEGIVGYQAIDNSNRMMDTTGSRKAHYIYLTTVWGADKSDTINGGQKEMRYVVDTTTFRLLGLYGIDKNHVYDINPMLDGGTIGINQYADVKTFQLVGNDFFAKDKRHCYYRGRIIEGADLKSFKVLDTSYSHFIAFDKNNFYDGEEKMSLQNIRQQKLDSIRQRKRNL